MFGLWPFMDEITIWRLANSTRFFPDHSIEPAFFHEDLHSSGHPFDFRSDDVAAGELGVVEDAAEDAFGEEVLHEHLFYGRVFEVGVDGFAAEVGKGGEAVNKDFVCFSFGFDERHSPFGDFRDAFGEFADGAVPVVLIGLAIFEE